MTKQTAHSLRADYLAGTQKPTEVVAKSLETIGEQNDALNVFLDVYESAAQQAAAAEELLAKDGESAPPLAGIPVALKHNIMVEGERVTAASKILENYTATYDATIVNKLKVAGAVLLGGTNMDEFAMGGSTENSAFSPSKNPIDPTRVPGGSSGGSAAAVAMGSVPVAIGTDTGGSIRQPASYCGVVGFKPTYGAVSRYGLIAMGSSLDQAGPLTNTVADAELVHSVMAGRDPMDMTTIDVDTYPAVETKETYRIGVPRDFLAEGVDPDVLEAFEAHLKDLSAAGHEVVDISLPLFAKGLAAYYIVMPAEVSSNLARYDGLRYGTQTPGETLLDVYEQSRAHGFGDEVKRRVLLGTYVLSAGYYDAYYGKAEAVRRLMRQELANVFTDVDVLATPTAPTPAFTFGAQADPLAMYRQDIFTVPVNLTGVPAISTPMATVDRDGSTLPVGVQYIAPHAGESRLFDLGKRIYDAQL
ncbi:Asp-tRNA(Asn)/Glu-tRNA(Gln) amidotransferase GatCAB subunit A [bacterium]|nr:Asp-tRNA(Asn)/Glu-tRNA(Gln) amidotransferase GatCAB subunit A [bacterium]|tara:strand:+ start:3830 stop:5251 length:1422 start_codon:yes stop_codon:yes gene_type:complete